MRIKWDQAGERLYETGVSNGVLFPQKKDGTYEKGVGWNGLSNVNKSSSGAEATAIYADNIKYLNLRSAEEYAATIEAYTYPKEFEPCNGISEVAKGVTIGQQSRQPFGFSYKTLIGNDTEGQDYGYKINLVYGCTAAPSEESHATVNESPEAITFSWELSTTPVEVKGHKPTACLTIDSTRTDAEKLKALEDIIYGTEDVEPRLPLPDEVIALIGNTVEEVAG